MKIPSVTSSSRPPTPAVSTCPAIPPKEEQAPLLPTLPSSLVVDSDVGSGGQDLSPSPERPYSAESMDNVPAAPVRVPPGLPDAPPGVPPPTRTPKADPAAAPGL